MADIFANTELRYGGGFTANKGIVQSIGGVLTGVLMQQLQWTYQQRVNQIYELGPKSANPANFYYVSGRSSGNATIGHILGPPVALTRYYSTYSDVCQAGKNTCQIDLSGSTCDNSFSTAGAGSGSSGGVRGRKATLKYCVLVQVGQQVGANDLLINENSNMMFGNCEYAES